MIRLKPYADAALAILLGERCIGCGRTLRGGGMCAACMLRLSYADVQGRVGNPIERRLWGHLAVVRASATLTYRPGAVGERLLHAIKYERGERIAVHWGRIVAREHQRAGFFEGIDAIVPVPLHPRRERERGFNQSLRLAEGIAQVTGLPIAPLIIRTRYTLTQTQLSDEERRTNVEGSFALAPSAEEVLAALRENIGNAASDTVERPDIAHTMDDTASTEGHTSSSRPLHLLILDDVITTGATCLSCARPLAELLGEAVCFSFLALAFAGQPNKGRIFPEELGRPDLAESGMTDYHQREFPDLF